MEIQGKIILKLQLQEGTSKAGNPWKKQEYVLETLSNYPRKVKFDFFGDRVDQFPLEVGDEVTAKVVDFNLDDHRVSISIKAMTAKPKAEEAKDDDDSEIASVDIEAVIAEENAKAEDEEPAPKKRTTKKKAAEEAPTEEAPSEEA